MSLSQRITNAIWGRSGGRCYLDRSEHLTRSSSGALPIGEIAHIVGGHVSGPRGKSELLSSERNSVENLILLCPNHHTEVDQYPMIWTVERLQRIKAEHEAWVMESLNRTENYHFDHRWDSRSELAIDFEEADSADKKQPHFTFSARNVSSEEVVVQSIHANVLALAPSWPLTKEKYEAYSTLMIISRIRLDFDLSEATEQMRVRPYFGFNPLEVALCLKPGELCCFAAKVGLGDHSMGTFVVEATFWTIPSYLCKSVSEKVGFFSYPKSQAGSGKGREASILSFEQLCIEALKRRKSERLEPGDDIFSRGQLFQRTLGSIGSLRSKARIEEWLNSDDSRYFIAALEAICSSENTQWKSTMIERAMSSNSEGIRLNAIAAIQTVQNTDAYETLSLKAFCDCSPVVKLKALERLSAEGSPQLIEAINRLVKDPDSRVRKQAIEYQKKS